MTDQDSTVKPEWFVEQLTRHGRIVLVIYHREEVLGNLTFDKESEALNKWAEILAKLSGQKELLTLITKQPAPPKEQKQSIGY